MDRDKIEQDIEDAKETLAEVEQALECEPPPYPWTESIEQDFRCFVFEHVVDTDLDVAIQIEQAQKWLDWLREGVVPKSSKTRHLKAVND